MISYRLQIHLGSWVYTTAVNKIDALLWFRYNGHPEAEYRNMQIFENGFYKWVI